MRSRYQINFESRMNSATSLNNYEYLDLLDRAWGQSGMERPAGGTLCDVGCASFWYAAALQAFFSPAEVVGVDIEGYRLFKDGRSRIDYATGYLADLPDGRFVVADYRSVELPADIITAWFPFVMPAAILAWRLPLSMLAPRQLFARIFHNLQPGGLFLMANHGPEEAEQAADMCLAVGLLPLFRLAEPGILSPRRPSPAILSAWGRQHAG